MAFIVWRGGAGDGRWNTAANWHTPATGAAAVPGGGDAVWIPPEAGTLNFYGDTGSVDSIAVGLIGSTEELSVTFGPAITSPVVGVYSGTVVWRGVSTDVLVEGGELTINTTDALSSLNVNGGTCYADQHGTISAVGIGSAGILDTTRTTSLRTLTGVTMQAAGGKFRRNDDHVTITTGIVLNYRGGLRSTALN